MSALKLSQELLNSFANAIHSLVLTKQKETQSLIINQHPVQEQTEQKREGHQHEITPVDHFKTQNQVYNDQGRNQALQLEEQKKHAQNQRQSSPTNNAAQFEYNTQFQIVRKAQTQRAIKKVIEGQISDSLSNFQLILPILYTDKLNKNAKKSSKANQKSIKADVSKGKELRLQKSLFTKQIEREIKQAQGLSLKPIRQKDEKKKAKKGSKIFEPTMNLNKADFEIIVQGDSQIKQYLQKRRVIYRVKRDNKSNQKQNEKIKIQENIQKPQASPTLPKLQKTEFQITIRLLPFQQSKGKVQRNEQSHNQTNNTPQQLSAPIKNKKQTKQTKRFQGFLKQRSKDTDQVMNIGIASLLDIVQQLADNEIISEDEYNQFASNHTIYDIRQFLQKFKSGILHKFDFNTIQFTLLDHRRLSELLIRLFPDRYTFTVPYAIDTSINDFLISMYDLPAQDYFNLYTKIDKISKIKWWSQIIQEQKKILLRKTLEQKKTNGLQQQNKSITAEFKDMKRHLREVYDQSHFSKNKFGSIPREIKTDVIVSNIQRQLSSKIPQSIISLRQKLRAN